MNTSEVSRSQPKFAAEGHRIEVGRYEEGMYFLDTDPVITDDDQEHITGLLEQNQGVGIMAGVFDNNMSIRMISGFAGRLLGFHTKDDYLNETGASLLNIVSNDAYTIRIMLQSQAKEVCKCVFRGKGGVEIPVRVGHELGTSKNGEPMWYISIRRFGEPQFDSLTGNYNGYGFIDRMKRLQSSGNSLTDCAIIYTNVESFKTINDLYGSASADKILIKTHDHLRTSSLNPLLCARKDSDKFLLLVKKENLDLSVLKTIMQIPYKFLGKQFFADCVCGIYYIDDNTVDVNTMIDCAKVAIESIADPFVTPFAVFDPSMRSSHLRKIKTLSRFDEALANHEFEVYYQPVVDCESGKVTSAEALIRWCTETDGMISPALFIPVLEENGCISKLDEYVITSTVKYLKSRAEQGLPIVPISVNLSRMDFFDDRRTKRVYDLLHDDPIARKYLHFEITETSHRSIKEMQVEFITKVNDNGGKVYIDDFGVANSSIDLLSQYDFSVLKLDMQFIREIDKNKKVMTLVRSTINMAHQLNMKVIAEGVETAEQLALLRGMDCDYIQGFYFSKPLTAEHFSSYLERHI